MRMRTLFTSSLLLAVCAATPAFASVVSQVASFRFTAVVKTVCRLEFANMAAPKSDDIVDLGQLTQLCNSRNGYRVTMVHPTNMGGATLMLGGQSIPLSNGNETVIVDANRAALQVSDAQLFLNHSDAELGSLSFRIEPKGATF